MVGPYGYDDASGFAGCVIGMLTIWPSSLMIRKRTMESESHVNLEDRAGWKRDVRIVKGSPLARRMLVKYTVPEPIGDEATCKLWGPQPSYLCDPSLGRSGLHSPVACLSIPKV